MILCHLTKVSAQINKCIIFEANELSVTLSTLWLHYEQWSYLGITSLLHKSIKLYQLYIQYCENNCAHE